MKTYLAKLGELTLKGSNIRFFEKTLINNLKKSLQKTSATIKLRAGRMYVECRDDDSHIVEHALSHLIGITAWAQTRFCDKNLDDIKQQVWDEAVYAQKNGATSFKIEARRGDKSFPLNSYQLCAEAAQEVFEKKLLKVDVHHPDIIIYIEVREKCYIYSNANRSCRGLPVGTGGRGLLMLSGGIDSPVAGYRMLRRGMNIDCVYFHSYPYTSDEAQKKAETLAQTLAFFGIKITLHIVCFTEVQMRIRQRGKENWATLLLRMCMIRAADILAKKINALCIISGESLGQVASQTIENMTVSQSMTTLPLLRPLVGLDKEEIVKTACQIGTYETSILPYEDCCVLFTPKHPVIHAKQSDAEKNWIDLDCEALIDESIEKHEIRIFENT